MNHTRIKGFGSSSEEDDKQKQEEEKRNTAIADFIRRNYAPIGTTAQKVYKTTAELQYDLHEFIDVSALELARQLTEARFAVEFVCGRPYWVMYERR